MNVSVSFPNEIEIALRLRAAATGQDVESVVRQLVTESLQDSESVPPESANPSEFARRLELWIALHPVLQHAIDDSRESIYAGCGE